MTTTAINKTEIAADGSITAGNTIITGDFNKLYKSKDFIWGCAGTVANYDLFRDFVEDNGTWAQVWKLPGLADEFSVLLVETETRRIFEIDNRGYFEVKENHAAIGSGYTFALAAMDLGMSPTEAVKYTIKRDCYSGGKVRTIKF